MPKKSKAGKSASKRLSARGGGYSWFVRISKIALPLVALALMTVVFMRLSQDPQTVQLTDLPTMEKTKPGQIALTGAKYEGMDAKGRKYTLSADRAVRNMLSDEAVTLENPRADAMLEDGSWVTVHAKSGDYDNKAQKLNLAGGVTVYHDSGYEMHLEKVDVDMATRHAVTTEPVSAQGPAGELKAQNMDVQDEGALVIFGGPVFLTLYSMKAKPPKKVRG